MGSCILPLVMLRLVLFAEQLTGSRQMLTQQTALTAASVFNCGVHDVMLT